MKAKKSWNLTWPISGLIEAYCLKCDLHYHLDRKGMRRTSSHQVL